MRNNQPVTNVEHVLEEGAALVSTTNLKGQITYANPSFVDISGFSEEELIGSPHNLVRHPDMPIQAFSDLWKSIKSGRSWTALVKNRCKNGDYYWVKANVTPLIENNRITGYMSVRTKPSRQEIARATAIYQQIRQGDNRYTLRNGLVVRTDFIGKLLSWGQLSVAARIWIAVIAMTFITIGADVSSRFWLESNISWGYFLQLPFLISSSISLISALLLGAWLSNTVAQPLRDILQFSRRISSGALGDPIQSVRHDAVGQIIRSLNQTSVNLLGVISDVSSQVDGMFHEIGAIDHGISDLVARTHDQVVSVEKTSTSMEEIHATVQQTADLANRASTLTKSASNIAVQGGQVVNETVMSMDDIKVSAAKIADIISVIDDVAFQTNILALNAAVEAARAGDEGRGFAVVANDVRGLAQKTAQAAKEIKGLIGESLTKVETGVRHSKKASEAMQEVLNVVEQVSTMMDQINHAATEQSAGIGQVNEATTQLDRATQENAAFVERITSAASLLTVQANTLSGAVNVFKINIR